MQWKEIFFYNRRDRIGILILSFFSSILCGSYLAYPYLKNGNVENNELREFAEFQRNLKPIYFSSVTEENNMPPPSPSISKSKLREGQRIDLNSANEKALKKIPGIGDTFAKRIVEYRTTLGGFVKIDQLTEIKGISEKKFKKIEPYFIIEKTHHKQSLSSFSKSGHPYLNTKQMASILSYIDSNNKKIASMESLATLEHFTPRDVERIKDYIHFK